MRQTCQEMSKSKKIFHKYISSKTKKTNSVEIEGNLFTDGSRRPETFDFFLINVH